MKKILGILIMIMSVIGGLYVGGWCMFIQPIMTACKAFDAGMLTGTIIGMTILECMFASCVGSLIYVIGHYVGMYIIYKE